MFAVIWQCQHSVGLEHTGIHLVACEWLTTWCFIKKTLSFFIICSNDDQSTRNFYQL